MLPGAGRLEGEEEKRFNLLAKMVCVVGLFVYLSPIHENSTTTLALEVGLLLASLSSLISHFPGLTGYVTKLNEDV